MNTLTDIIIRFRNYLAVISAMCLPLSLSAALNASCYTTSSKLGDGHWVKIRINESGMHQITDQELRQMGFNDPAKVAILGYPANIASDYRLSSSLPDDLPAVPAVHSDGKLIFYAGDDVNLSLTWNRGYNIVQVTRNYFADYGTYFLTDSQEPARPATSPYQASTLDQAETSVGMCLIDEELYNQGTIGARFFGEDFRKTPLQHYTLHMPGYDGTGNICLQYLMGLQPLNSQARVYFTLPDGQTAYADKDAVDDMAYQYSDLTYTALIENLDESADGSYPTSIDLSTAKNLGYGALDYITASYPRRNALDGENQAMMVFTSLAATQPMAFSRQPDRKLSIWNVTDRINPQVFEPAVTDDESQLLVSAPCDYDITGTAGASCAYIMAFDPESELPGVEFLGEVPNQNLHAASTPHMLIVAARNVLPQAERLAELHRKHDGIDVLVAAQEDIYNEFSSGTPHLMAIRRMARMFRDRNPEKFRSILLFGEARYDSRGIAVGKIDPDFRSKHIPMFICEDLGTAGSHNASYATDAFVGMLDENVTPFNLQSSKMTVSVSRIPASAPSDAEAYVYKVERMLTSPVISAAYSRALLLSDDGDSNGHLADADSLAKAITACSPSTTIYRAYNSLYPWDGIQPATLNRRIAMTLAQGVGFMAYSGHSGPNGVGGNIWTSLMAADADANVYPFTIFSSCRALYIDHEGSNLGSTMLLKENGGSISVIGSLREVYKDYNQVLNLAIGETYFSASPGTTTGEVFRLARNRVIDEARKFGGNRLINNTLCYNIIGDPEIRIPVPEATLRLTSVNDTGLTETDVASIEPEQHVTLAGEVLDAGGNIDETFSGNLILSLYDSPKSVPVINGTPAIDVTVDEDLIMEKKTRVTDGRFSVKAYLPASSNPDGSNRLTMYAIADDGGRRAAGVAGNISIADKKAGQQTDDSTLPVITSMYVDTPDFTEGDIVGGDITLHAEIAPNEIGVTGVCTLIGKSLTLTLDRYKSYEAAGNFTASEDGGGTLEFPISGLTDGHHQLTLKVANYAGQTASRTIAFTVINNKVEAALAVEEYPASDNAVITLSHNFNESPSARIIIKNASGKVVFATDRDIPASFPFSWNLCDSNGTPVPEGAYYIGAYLNAGGAYGSAREAEIIVNRD